MKNKLKILFLCTGNSCRSQMAEGWARHLKSQCVEAFSAGIERHGLNQNAVRVMAESGVDISGQRSKLVGEFSEVELDVVVTVCGHAQETCPVFTTGCRVVHVGFEDPPKLAMALAKQGVSEDEQLMCYRKVRDEIRAYIEKLPEVLEEISDE